MNQNDEQQMDSAQEDRANEVENYFRNESWNTYQDNSERYGD